MVILQATQWVGPRVNSKEISVELIKEITEIIEVSSGNMG